MATKLLLDNWLLFDVQRLLLHGCAGDKTSRLVVEPNEGMEYWEAVPSGPVQVEGLIRLLVDIVTRDTLVVDSHYRSAWENERSPMGLLLAENIVQTETFDDQTPNAQAAEKAILKKLCVTEHLQQKQSEIEQSWYERGSVYGARHSVIVKGSAGYLTRSYLRGVPYSGHPFRKQFIEQTVFRSPTPDATTSTLRWMETQRTSLFTSIAPDHSTYSLGAILPPMVIDIIEASRTAEDLIPVAIQMRKDYAKMREWMSDYQAALESEEPSDILKHERVLRSVGNNLLSKLGKPTNGQTSMSVSFSFFELSLPISPFEVVKQRIGIRAILNRLIFSKGGEGTLRKLVAMFDEKSTPLGSEIVDYLLLQPNNKTST